METEVKEEKREPVGTIHINGEEILCFSTKWVDCEACYWVNGHLVYTLEDGTEVYDYDTDEGLQG